MKIAVVTGASSGMGRVFVQKLDDMGFDEIWGIGLSKEALEEAAETAQKALDKVNQ